MKSFAKVFLLCGVVVSGFAQGNDYFPYGDGDVAVFAGQNGSERDMTVTATQGDWRQVQDFLGLGSRWIYSQADDNRLWVYNSETGYGELLVDLDGVPGMSFDTPMGACQSSAVIDDRELTVTTPAGRFDGVVRVDFSGSCADAGLASVWFAPEVGVVRYSEQSIIGPVAYDLSGASIGDRLLPAQAGVVISSDMPMGRVMNDASVSVGMTVTNAGSEPLQLTFPSSQRFDVLVYDAAGRLVRQWSANKRFTQAVETISIAPGASQRFGTEFALTTDNGAALDVGSYVLRFELTGYSTPGASVFSDQRAAFELPLHVDARMSAFGQ